MQYTNSLERFLSQIVLRVQWKKNPDRFCYFKQIDYRSDDYNLTSTNSENLLESVPLNITLKDVPFNIFPAFLDIQFLSNYPQEKQVLKKPTWTSKPNPSDRNRPINYWKRFFVSFRKRQKRNITERRSRECVASYHISWAGIFYQQKYILKICFFFKYTKALFPSGIPPSPFDSTSLRTCVNQMHFQDISHECIVAWGTGILDRI